MSFPPLPLHASTVWRGPFHSTSFCGTPKPQHQISRPTLFSCPVLNPYIATILYFKTRNAKFSEVVRSSHGMDDKFCSSVTPHTPSPRPHWKLGFWPGKIFRIDGGRMACRSWKAVNDGQTWGDVQGAEQKKSIDYDGIFWLTRHLRGGVAPTFSFSFRFMPRDHVLGLPVTSDSTKLNLPTQMFSFMSTSPS